MTSVAASHSQSVHGENHIAGHRVYLPLIILLAVGLGLVMTFARAVSVWQTGSILDPDDAMRLVQVRALLAGQNWFDMTVYRLDPPGGSVMHWSRVVDVPLALLMKTFGFFMPAESAERLTRITFPLLLQAALYAATGRLAKNLLGRDAIMPAVFLVLLSGIAFGQFQPGRVDHHAPQIVLLVFILGALAEAIREQRMMPVAVASGLSSLSLAISLENMPFILVLWGLIVALWVWRAASMRLVMRGFAVGFLTCLPLCFFTTVGPAHWLEAVPDAFSFGQFIAGMSGAVLCLGLTVLPEPFNRRSVRFVLAAGSAAAVFGLIALFARGSLEGPFAHVDPLIRDIWLRNVHEAWPFSRLLRHEPDTALMFMLPLVLGLAALLAAVLTETGVRRLQWIMVTAVCLTGFIMSLWLIRVFSSVGPIASLGGLWAVMTLNRWLARKGYTRYAALWTFVLLLPFGSIPWALAIGGDENKAKAAADDCHASEAFAPFTALPSGLILAPIDAGSHLLAFTSHTVLAAPYHRNNYGNLVALDAFLAPPDQSLAIVKANGVKYVAICPSLGETSVLAKRGPQSLSAALAEGRVPDWLAPVSAANTPYKIFTVRP